MAERGAIKNPTFRNQLNDFKGLRYGNGTPTDIDAFMEFGNKLFIFIECKYGDAEMPRGQELAFERVVDACHLMNKRMSVGFVVKHVTPAPFEIDYANTTVTKIRYQDKWKNPLKAKNNLRDAIDYFRARRGITLKITEGEA